ncbi:hypothetical protein [Micrococcus luteus]|uniref:hypothetical protein n=1 Tax=Micrococcus luteus TaxID=1270 RepID=UPI0034010618
MTVSVSGRPGIAATAPVSSAAEQAGAGDDLELRALLDGRQHLAEAGQQGEVVAAVEQAGDQLGAVGDVLGLGGQLDRTEVVLRLEQFLQHQRAVRTGVDDRDVLGVAGAGAVRAAAGQTGHGREGAEFQHGTA